jgi:type IV pilus biogenesis protein CpaD/CtpE
MRGTNVRFLWLSLALPILLASSGCTMVQDPMMREGTWHPTGASAANLAAMVANPHDLVEGESASGTIGPEAVLPVARLRADKVKPLPDNAIVQIGGTTTSNNSSSGGSALSGSGN